MTFSLVDAGSLHQVVQAFDRSHDDQDEWCVQTAINTTTLLLTPDTHYLPPAIPNRKQFYPGILDHLTLQLLKRNIIAPRLQLQETTLKQSMTTTKSWAAKNPKLLKELFNKLASDNRNFPRWLEWSTRTTWNSPEIAKGVLFDPAFSKYISTVLEVAEKDLIQLHQRSKDMREIKHIVAHQGGSTSSDFNLLVGAYVLSFMLRGRYHDTVARNTQCQINQHPIREMACSPTSGAVAHYCISNTLEALARIIFYGAAISQRSLEKRLDCWVDNIVRVKSAINSGSISLQNFPTTSSAIDSAAKSAKLAGIETGGAKIGTCLRIIAALGIGTLSELYVETWGGVGAGLVVGLAADTTLQKLDACKVVGNLYHNSEHRLKQIAADTGRRKFKWSPSSK